MKRKSFNQFNIKRTHEHEIHQAIKDLEARGYVLKYGPKLITKEGKTFDKDSYNRPVFRENIQYGIWVATIGVPN